MALLLDLPAAARRDLARRWGTEENTALLYRTMTDPAALDARLRDLPPSARQIAAQLGRAPATAADLLARFPVSAASLDRDLVALAELGIVLRLPDPPAAPPRLAEPPLGAERLYVPSDLAAALEARP